MRNAGLPGARAAATAALIGVPLLTPVHGTCRANAASASAQVAPYYLPGPYERHWLGYPAWPAPAYGPCYPFASCWALRDYQHLQRRERRFDALGGDTDAGNAPIDALPHGPPSPESELQPGYRNSGKVLPQFEHAGEVLPGYQGNAPGASPQ